MKKRLIVTIILAIICASTAVCIDLSSKGRLRLWKEAENHVKIQRTITDPNGVLVVVWERSYGIDEVEAKLLSAQKDFEFYDMNDIEAIKYVREQKKKASAKVAKWTAVKNKFAGAIDTK